MRISRLHIKIFLTSTVILVAAELLAFGVYRFGFGRDSFGRFEGIARTHASLLREAVARRNLEGGGSVGLQRLVASLADGYGGRVWIVAGGVTLADSGRGAVPVFPSRRVRNFADFSIAWDGDGRLLVRLPLVLAESRHMVLFFRAREQHESGREFIPALVGLAIAFLVLALPMARFVTRPVASLRDSAMRFAAGDLDQCRRVRQRRNWGAGARV